MPEARTASRMPLEEAIIAARPPGPKGFELDAPSLIAQDRIARTRVGTYPTTEDGLVIIEDDSKQGYFSKGAVLPRTWEEPLVAPIANIAAFAIGMTDERNATPTIEYMRKKKRVVGRNADTAMAFDIVTNGYRKEADPVINRTFLGHVQVHLNAMAQAEGPHPERAVYDPFDTERGIWTIGSLGWAHKEVFETLVRPFSESEDGAFQGADMPLFGGLFGSEAPENSDELVRKRIANGELNLTGPAKIVAMQNWQNLTLPRWLLPARKYVVQFVAGILPEEVRDMFDLSWGLQQEKEFQKAATLLSMANKALKLTRKDVPKYLFTEADKEEARLRSLGLMPKIPDPYAQSV